MMKKILASALGAAVLVAGCSEKQPAAGAQENLAADKAEIARVDETVMNAKSGADMVPYLDPSRTFIWDVAGDPAHGYGVKGVEKHIDDILATSDFDNFKPKLVRIEVETDGKLGWANSIQNLKIMDPAGKTVFDADYRVTNTYRKVDGKWLMVSEHLSFPIDLKTQKPVLGKIPFPEAGNDG
jgi:ketosteroid isomerase-like protein